MSENKQLELRASGIRRRFYDKCPLGVPIKKTNVWKCMDCDFPRCLVIKTNGKMYAEVVFDSRVEADRYGGVYP